MSNVIPFPGSEPPVEPAEVHLPASRSRTTVQRPPDRDRPSTELVGPVVVGELVDEDDRPQLVDPPPAAQSGPPWSREVHWSPVVPGWWSDRDTRRAAAAYWRRKVVHTVEFHALRAPVYAARLLGQAPRGAGRTLVGATRWVRAVDLADQLAAARADGKAAIRAVELRREQALLRSVLLVAAVAVALALYWTTGRTTVGWDRPLLALAALLALGVAGRRRDKPIVGPAVEVQRAPRLTSETVLQALGSLGIPKIDQALTGKRSTITFAAPITRDGPGWRADVDLPLGVTAVDVMEKRPELASGLRRPLGCVWPGPDAEVHEGRLVLWVGDQAMNKAKAPPWPLAKAGQADIFKPVPFGHDQRGRLVTVSLIFESVLIGSKPRMGKTFALRVLALAAALDPIVEQRVFELKGTGDLDPLQLVAHHYGSGVGDDTLDACMRSLRDVYNQLETRAKTISGLPKAACPENKVTPQLARRRSLGLHPLMFIVDECQELFSHPEYGGEADRLCTAIIKRGPALGIMLVLATQRPDAKSLPTGVSDNVGIRFCLRVMGQMANDMVLGTSSYKNGLRATTFTKSDKGIGILVGASDDSQIIRTAYLDGPASVLIAERARGLREAAGTLSGYAAGEQLELDTGPDLTVLHDLVQVFGPMEEKAHSDDLCARLADAWPGRYEGWAPRQLSAAVKPYGLKAKQVWAAGLNGAPANKWGFERKAIEEVLAARDGAEDGPP